jgi:ligand-binding sensor domain-containing protein
MKFQAWVYFIIAWGLGMMGHSQGLMAQDDFLWGYHRGNGLLSDNIKAVQSLPDGMTWVLTSRGLFRFDGNQFWSLTHHSGQMHSAPSGEIRDIKKDRNGNLWLLQEYGMSVLPARGRSFHHFPLPEAFRDVRLHYGFHQLPNREIWLGAQGDFIILNPQTGTYRRSGWRRYIDTKRDRFDAPINGLGVLEKSEHEIWLLATNGLFSVDVQSGQFQSYPMPPVSNLQGMAMYFQKGSTVYFGSYHSGIMTFDPTTGVWDAFPLPDSIQGVQHHTSVYGLSAWNSEEILGFTPTRYVRFHVHQKTYRIWKAKDELGMFGQVAPQGIHYDSDAQRWWLASSGGLYTLSRTPAFRFQHIATKAQPKLPHFQVLWEDAEKHWWASSPYTDQLFMLNPAGEVQSSTRSLNGNALEFVTQIRQDPKGNLWLCMRNAILIKARGKSEWQKLNMPDSPGGFQNRVFWDVVFDKAGFGYVCSWTDGVIQFDPHLKFVRFLPFPDKGDNRFLALSIDKQRDRLYLATEKKGLGIWHLLEGRWDFLRPNGAFCVTDVALDAKGNVWFGTSGQGLNLYMPNCGACVHWGRERGLRSEQINWCKIDRKGRLWVATPGSMHQYLPHSGRFRAFDVNSGYPDGEVLPFFETSQGEILFGAFQGILRLSEFALDRQNKSPKPYWESLRAGNTPLFGKGTYTLDHTQNDLNIQFGAVDYGFPSEIQFRYRILPDSQWHFTTEREIHVLNLAPGSYSLELAAKNSSDIWSASIHTALVIEAPWWHNPMLWIVGILTVIALAIWIIRRRMAVIQEQAKLKIRVSELEIEAFRSRLNPHFVFNCLSSIDNLIHSNATEAATRYLNRFSKLLRDVLEHSQLPDVPFIKDWEHLQRYLELEQLRFDQSLTIELHADPSLFSGNYRVPPMLIQPLVENAIHHGLRHRAQVPKCLTVEASLHDDALIYTIEDNGIGREAAAQLRSSHHPDKSSQGIALCKERLQQFNGMLNPEHFQIEDLYDASGKPCGTRISIHVCI